LNFAQVGQLGPGPEHFLATLALTPDLVQTGHARETVNEVIIGFWVGCLVDCLFVLTYYPAKVFQFYLSSPIQRIKKHTPFHAFLMF
jgi:hypothetical protein